MVCLEVSGDYAVHYGTPSSLNNRNRDWLIPWAVSMYKTAALHIDGRPQRLSLSGYFDELHLRRL